MAISLPADQALKAALENHRATVRYRCAPATPGKVTVPQACESQRAWVVNLSKGGVGLTLSTPLPSGTPISIQMRGADLKQIFEFPAQVVHSTVQSNGEWMIGCEWLAPLSDQDLDALL